MTTLLTQKQARPIPSDEDTISPTCLRIVNRNLPPNGGPPTRETVQKICVDDDLVENAEKEVILRYFLMMSSLTIDDLRPLWGHLEHQYVVRVVNQIKTLRRRRELVDWKPRWASQ